VNPVAVAQQQQCQNNQQDCEYWASLGECTVNPIYMQYQCKKSCGIAPCPIRSLPSARVSPVIQAPVEPANVITPITDPNCKNTHELCDFWASNFQCETNAAYMLTVCREACLQCARGGWISTGQRCADDNADCGYWASAGECSTNRFYMRWKCKRSCSVC